MMDTKEEKKEQKERKQSYFARLKKKKQTKQNAEIVSAAALKSRSGKDDANSDILEQDKFNTAAEGDHSTDDKKKRKNNQLKEIRRTELKRYYSVDDNQNKTHDKKEKKMVVQKPQGTMEYTARSQDTLNSVALKFNITPNKLVELNKLFTHTIVPGQVLFVPDANIPSSTIQLSSSTPGATVSPSSSDAEYDKLPDADLARKALKPIERVLSSTSEEDEPGVVKFLKMNCRYFTDGKGVVGGVMIVTPNNIMFDPHKSDPLVIENGCEEYGLICPMEEVVSIALYSDISHMKIKDALPSPGEWEDLASEKEINPFSKFKSINKEKRQQNGERTPASDAKSVGSPEESTEHTCTRIEPPDNSELWKLRNLQSSGGTTMESPSVAQLSKGPSGKHAALEPTAKETCLSKGDEDFVDLEELSSQPESGIDRGDATKECLSDDQRKDVPHTVVSAKKGHVPSAQDATGTESDTELKGALDLETGEKQDEAPDVDKQAGSPEKLGESTLHILEDLDKMRLIEFYLNENKEGSQLVENVQKSEPSDRKSIEPGGIDITLSSSVPQAGDSPPEGNKETGTLWVKGGETLPLKLDASAEDTVINNKEVLDSLGSSLDKMCHSTQMDNKSEIQLWLLKRIQVPIEDILPSKEEKSKTPPMFLCIKVGKPMRKSFASHTATMVQQYSKRRKQPEYWFAVPRERVDHLYTFFVQWSPDVYGKDAKEQGFVVVEKEELNMIDNFFSEPTTKSWEIITVEEAKRRKSTCSYYEEEEEEEEGLPILQPHSALLENMHIEQLARRLPARVQGYPWRLAYSTLEHGTSLKTLYRKSASLDSPVLLVIKDMDNQIFGAYATHPFKFSDHYYGTGETFLYTFSPNFKVFKWSGENSYFINGDISSLELGGGGGRFGLWLDADLYHGRSNSCSTFNNDILSKKEDFIVQDLEVWTFE
ncbi:nuclear receptor coactivator 7 isoform X2 [Mus pahari]|uniref:nuclear receptor coactivator 7 isoform X2 n=1 Tax=Mus pahari TaxID=10093 RepID=UPI000A31322B|nr:nuclear receptor coactivator 7 isoform X2 [Mus pahari]XP_029388732.1 nuclear receptor coactivator 7 isoform X2 [Mus pahari]